MPHFHERKKGLIKEWCDKTMRPFKEWEEASVRIDFSAEWKFPTFRHSPARLRSLNA
jgi:hypothetical protein